MTFVYGVRLLSRALLRTARLERKFISGDDVPVDTIIVIGCLRAMPSGPCRSVSDPLRQNEPNCRSNGGNSSSE